MPDQPDEPYAVVRLHVRDELGWAVVDSRTGAIAIVGGELQMGLLEGAAAEIARRLNCPDIIIN